jgi:hypothetical protein
MIDIKHFIRSKIHKFIVWYLKYKCGGMFHHGSYSQNGVYVRVFTDEYYGYIQRLLIEDNEKSR